MSSTDSLPQRRSKKDAYQQELGKPTLTLAMEKEISRHKTSIDCELAVRSTLGHGFRGCSTGVMLD